MRKKIDYTEQKISELLKEGRGQGEGKDYIPWVKVGEFMSNGRCTRALGKSGRSHHLFSDLEENYYNILEWADSVLDIREQFPLLPVYETERIAAEKKKKHPKCFGTKNSFVMTTDFLITVKNKCGSGSHLEARSAKYSAEFEKKKVRDRQEIEEYYWAERGIPWEFVTEKSFTEFKAKNIDFLLGYYINPIADLFSSEEQGNLISKFVEDLLNRDIAIKMITNEFDVKMNLPTGSSLSMFYYLAVHKIIPINIEMNKRIRPSMNVSEIVDIQRLKLKMFSNKDESNGNKA